MGKKTSKSHKNPLMLFWLYAIINEMAIFLSTFVNSIDGKGRVVLPKEFRAVVENEFKGFVAFRSHKLNAVDGFSMQRMEKLSQKMEEDYDPFSPQRDSLETAIFADAVTIRFDKDGRIVIPTNLLEHAKIDDKVAFVGRGATFQIWNPELFAAHQKEARSKLHAG